VLLGLVAPGEDVQVRLHEHSAVTGDEARHVFGRRRLQQQRDGLRGEERGDEERGERREETRREERGDEERGDEERGEGRRGERRRGERREER